MGNTLVILGIGMKLELLKAHGVKDEGGKEPKM